METLFRLFSSEILRQISLFASADITFYIIVLALFMWIWNQVDRLMKNR